MHEVLLATVRTHDEVYELMGNCDEIIKRGITNFPTKTYEEGVAVVLSWITDDADIITPLASVARFER